MAECIVPVGNKGAFVSMPKEPSQSLREVQLAKKRLTANKKMNQDFRNICFGLGIASACVTAWALCEPVPIKGVIGVIGNMAVDGFLGTLVGLYFCAYGAARDYVRAVEREVGALGSPQQG